MPPDFGCSAASAALQIAGKHNIAAANARTLRMLSSLDNLGLVPGLLIPDLSMIFPENRCPPFRIMLQPALADWRRRYRRRGGEATPGAAGCIGNWDDGSGIMRRVSAFRPLVSRQIVSPDQIVSPGDDDQGAGSSPLEAARVRHLFNTRSWISAFQAACLCFGSEASTLRSASTDSEISPRRQISGVVIWPCAFGIGC